MCFVRCCLACLVEFGCVLFCSMLLVVRLRCLFVVLLCLPGVAAELFCLEVFRSVAFPLSCFGSVVLRLLFGAVGFSHALLGCVLCVVVVGVGCVLFCLVLLGGVPFVLFGSVVFFVWGC